MIDAQLFKSNEIQFPPCPEEINTVAILNRENQDDKYFQIFDIRRNSFIRRIQKKVMTDEAFCLDSTGRFLAYVEDEELIFKLIRLPSRHVLVDMLRPRYQSTDNKLNVAQATESK